MEHIERAVYDTVHDSKMSCASIAKSLGMSHQVLINKANPQCDTHKLSLLEAVAIMHITGNKAIYRALGIELDIEAGDRSNTPTLLEAALNSAKEHGDVIREIQKAIQDGNLTQREREICLREIDESIASHQELQKQIVVHSSGRDLKAV